MERFSYIAPVGHLSHLSIGAADRATLARIDTKTGSSSHRHNLTASSTTSALSDLKGSSLEETAEVNDGATDFSPGKRFYLAFAALASLSLVVALDGTSISVALPTIAQALSGSATDAFWAGTSFLLTSTIFQLVYAAFSNLFGRKNLTLLAVVLFLIGTIVAGASTNMTMMLVGRSVQGIGGGGLMTLTNILVTDLVPLRYRGQWIGILGAMWAIGSVSGPVVGGSLAKPSLWHWIFWLNIPFIAASFILVTLFIRLQTNTMKLSTKLRQADWIGSAIFVGSTTSVLVPLTWGGITYPWSSWRVLVPLGFGAMGFVLLTYHERYTAVEPIIKAEVFTNRTTNIAYLTTALHGMVLWSLLYYQPMYFEGVLGYKPVIAGIALFPATFTVAPMAIVTGVAITRTGHYRAAVWAGWGLTLLGTGFLCAVDTKSQLVQIVITDLAIGIGLGALFPALQFQLQSACKTQSLGTAVAMFTFSRGLGQTIGVAAGGNIFQNSLLARLKAQPIFADSAMELAKDATGVVHWLQSTPASDDAKTVMQVAFVDSLRMVYIGIAAVTCVSLVLSLFVKEYNIDQAQQTDQFLVDDAPKQKRLVAGRAVDV